MKVETFAERVIRKPLWPHQIEAANSAAFITAVAAARRTGKSVLAEVLAIYTAFENAGCRVLILSATQDAARRIVESINDTLAAQPETRGAVVDDFSTRIKLANGSQIVSLPASQKQIRGYGEGVLLTIIDEASFTGGELFRAASYTALDEKSNGSRIYLLGTPFGSADHYFRQAFLAGQTDDPDHAAHHWTYKVNPKLDAAFLERQRDRVSPAEFSAEVLGEWSDAAGQLFPDSLIADQTVAIEAPSLAQLIAGDARPSLGLDWGVSFDRSAAAMVYRLPGVEKLNAGSDGRPKFIVLSHIWKQGERLSKVVDDIHRLPATYLSPETNGVGAGPSQQLREAVRAHRGPRPGKRTLTQWNFVSTTSKIKTSSYGALLGLAERGQLFWPNDPEFLRQLRGLKFEQRDRGFTSIENDPGIAQHDDVVDAAALSMYPRVKNGRVVCGVSVLANPKNASDDVELAESPPDFVEAGSGFRVYRRPPLQSVGGGSRLTLPGVDPATLADESELRLVPVPPQIQRAREAIRAAQTHDQEDDPDAE